jgi:hypothetical protein
MEEKIKLEISDNPKLLAIGWGYKGVNSSLIYLLEDEYLFYGYAQNLNYNPCVKMHYSSFSALRWCRGLILPRGDEDVRKLYAEAMELIKKGTRRYVDIQEYIGQRWASAKYGKEQTLNLEEQAKRTLADPVLSKHFL